jgi:hypothetical protein
MKKQAMTMPPPQVTPKVNLDDPKLLNMVNGGGSVAVKKKKEQAQEPAPDSIKNFSIKLFNSELEEIKTHLLGVGGRKTKSIQTFILEAISEKLKKETKR